MMKFIAILIFVVIFMVALVFSVLNFQFVDINLYFLTISLPLTVALTIELFAGILIGYLVAMINIIKLKTKYTQLSRKVSKDSQISR